MLPRNLALVCRFADGRGIMGMAYNRIERAVAKSAPHSRRVAVRIAVRIAVRVADRFQL